MPACLCTVNLHKRFSLPCFKPNITQTAHLLYHAAPNQRSRSLPAYNPTPSTPGISKPHVGCHCSPAGALYRIQQSCPGPPGQHGTTLSAPVQPSRLLQTATHPRHMSVKLQQHQAKPCRKSCCSPCCTNYEGRTPLNDSRGTGVLAPAGVTGTHIGGGGAASGTCTIHVGG